MVGRDPRPLISPAPRGRPRRRTPGGWPRPDRPSDNLPAPLTSFVGRSAELSELKGLLTDSAACVRLVTLTGVGGGGKTRLALQLAAQLADRYPDGVWLVDLAGVADPRLLPQAVANALDVRERPGGAMQSALRAALRSRRTLIVLDNCDHLVEACAALVADLLMACPALQVLATSREALDVAGEVAWPTPPLGLPPEGSLASEELLQYEAVHLFCERARLVQPGFTLTPRNAATVAAICRRLDGLPLAIELAAARLKTMALPDLAACLDGHVGLVATGARVGPARHRTLAAAIDGSYDSLAEAEQALFRRLAVFAGGFPLAAVAVIGGAAGMPDAGTTLDLLGRLVDKSLVQVEATADGTRYRLLETLRQYARKRLDDVGDTLATQARHCDWCLALVEAAGPALHSAEQLDWLERLEAERDNLRAALAWCLAHEPRAALRLASGLWPAWLVRTALAEGRYWLDAALQASARVDEAEPARTWHAAVMLGAGVLAREQADLTASRDHLEAGLALGQTLGDPRLLADLLRERAQLHLDAAESLLAQRRAEEALRRSRTTGDRHALAGALSLVGELAAIVDDDFQRANALHEEALIAARTAGDRWQLSKILTCHGWLMRLQGQSERAQALLDEGLAAAEAVGSPQLIVKVRRQLGLLAAWRGDLPSAEAHHAVGLAIARATDDGGRTAFCLTGLAEVALARGDAARARRLLDESQALFAAQANAWGLARASRMLGCAARADGDLRSALAHLRDSLARCVELDDRLGLAHCLELIAWTSIARHQRSTVADRAARVLGAADALRQRLGVPRAPAEGPEQDTALRALRSQLGTTTVAAALTAGAMLPLASAVMLARSLASPPETTAPAMAEPSRTSSARQTPGWLPSSRGVALDGFTRREREVLDHLLPGLSNRQIAQRLAISERTVEAHVANILGKLGLTTRVQIVAWAAGHAPPPVALDPMVHDVSGFASAG